MFCGELAQAGHQRGLLAKMFANAAGAADLCAQRTDAQYAIEPGRFCRFAHLTMARLAFRAEFGHIANDQYPVARHLRQHLYRSGQRADVGVIGIIQQQLAVGQLNRE